jgi:hypothetical protein
MNFHLLCNFSRRQVRWGMVLSVLSTFVAFGTVPVLGQGWVGGSRPATKDFVSPWETGLNKANLGTIASIGIPQGYRLMNDSDARAFLERLGNPVPKGLIGILAPQSGQWWAVLAFTSTGYLKDADKQALDPVEILQAIRKRVETESLSPTQQGRPPSASVEWKELPSYYASTHSLAWAIQAETQHSRTINNTVLTFGRTGVLELTAVQAYQPGADLPPVIQLARNISFKEGKRYEDYQIGDKVANISILGLIVDDEHPEFWNTRLGPRYFAWVFYSLIACLTACGVVLYTKRRRPSVTSRIASRPHQPAAATQTAGFANVGTQAGLPQDSGPLSLADASLTAKSGGQKVGTNGKNGSNGSKRGKPDKRGRKLVFNYAKFYTDFVMNTEPAIKPAPSFKLNGNGHANGNGSGGLLYNGHNGDGGTAPSHTGLPTVKLAELIADQKSLIEGQKHLIQEQTRFIEEKKKFFSDQNQLLERQTAMFENQYSLKLD